MMKNLPWRFTKYFRSRSIDPLGSIEACGAWYGGDEGKSDLFEVALFLDSIVGSVNGSESAIGPIDKLVR